MIFPLKFALGLAILALPIIELALLIKAGAAFGFWPVFLWIMATAVIGSASIWRSGLSIFPRILAHIEAGRSGLEPMIDQLLAVTGGVLLILPGLLGDAVGALLLLPPVRWATLRALAAFFTMESDPVTTGAEERTSWQDGPFSRGREPRHASRRGREFDAARRREQAEPPIIEGEYHRLDDDQK